MKTNLKMKALAIVAVTGALLLTSAPAFATSGARPYTCRGGTIPSGTYSSVTVTGPCAVADDAVITVTGSVLVTRGAAFDAQSAPATITVRRDVTALSGSMLGLGCQSPAVTGNSAHPCTSDPAGQSTITVRGNITALDASVVLLNGISVGGSVTALGGGSDVIPWSVKNDQIAGNLTIAGQNTEWVGVLFNTIGKNVTLLHIALSDPDPGAPGVYVVRNSIGRSLACAGLTVLGVPGVTGYGNTIGGAALGQCSALG